MNPADSNQTATPHDALAKIQSSGLIPLYSSSDPDELYRVAVAIVSAGISVLEVTLRAPGVVDALARLITRVEEDALPLTVGAGTVVGAAAADAAIEAGARFVFSPIVEPAVAARCHTGGVIWIPGCATPTEIHAAMQLGCQAVKLFPADAIGGPGFLRSIRSVFPTVEAIPSGGVVPNQDVLKQWFGAGAVAVAIGSALFPGSPTSDEDWSEVERRLGFAVSAVAMAKVGLTT